MSTSPPVVGPSPEKIGKSFIKQYYQTLLTNPSQLIRFYQADSTISRGNAADMAETAACAPILSGEDPGEAVRSAFFAFADVAAAANEGGEQQLSIDFSSGAIDAQESVGGGILLVVTGHMYLPRRTGFVHTFFLNNAAPEGRKKVFYVKNDVLRFLGEDMVESVDVGVDAGVVGMNGSTQTEEIVEEEQQPAAVEEIIEEEVPVVEQFVEEEIDYNEPAAEEEKMEIIDDLDAEAIAEDEPAAEEEKLDVVDDTPPDSPANSKGSDGKRSKRNRRKKGGKSSRSNSPSDKEEYKEDTPEKPKTPGSWASLVATGQPKKSGRRSSPKSRRDEKPSTPANHDKPAQDRTPKAESTPAPTSTAASSNTRTPEATLFIRNVPDATKESEIRSLFESVAASNGNKILGITLNPSRGFCFVDFDSVKAVDAVVAEAEISLVKEPRTGRKVSSSFMVHGRVLDVERKVKSENKGYRGSRGRAGMRRSPPRGR
ncbi:hypothetical protein ACHAWO_006915 [Cyclotella atomus]|jgi:hypothetical protein|uniref:NTF2 domain-containing protein n=1 Tax=Cyclotella atomus TaxID=382360 RepID=A0ABD3MVU1_9STRA